MIDISEYITSLQDMKERTNTISLSGKLEGIIGNYFVSGEGIYRSFGWLTVYYDADVDTYTEEVESVEENIIAYVTSDYRWAFVLTRHFQKFQEDTKEYGMAYISVDSFDKRILRCTDTHLLPDEFEGINWIDDDFMDDENIPFDYEAFASIDEGIRYLNPNHFSVSELVGFINKRSDSIVTEKSGKKVEL